MDANIIIIVLAIINIISIVVSAKVQNRLVNKIEELERGGNGGIRNDRDII